MNISTVYAIAAVLLLASSVPAQSPQPVRDPFPQPIAATDGLIQVQFVEFASLPDVAGQAQPARMMLLLNEAGTRRLFVNDMRGPLYSVSYDGYMGLADGGSGGDPYKHAQNSKSQT